MFFQTIVFGTEYRFPVRRECRCARGESEQNYVQGGKS